jgi:glucuronokinase
VGLVGNPSDGYGGAVLAAIVDTWAASVEVRPLGRALRVRNDAAGVVEWASAGEVLEGAPTTGAVVGHELVIAALGALHAHVGGAVPSVDVRWSSTIPRSVGLAGSSAIAVGVIEAVSHSTGHVLDPRVIAALALEAETVGLGIAAGWQDRIAQACRSAVLVDTASMTTVGGREVPEVRPLPGLGVDVVVGWRAGDAEDSGQYHGDLRRRAGSVAVVTGMRELAALARGAAGCVERADVGGLRELVDRSWCTRRTTAPLRPAHERLVEAVRATGAAATSPGSGGSVVALPAGPHGAHEVVRALDAAGAEHVVARVH